MHNLNKWFWKGIECALVWNPLGSPLTSFSTGKYSVLQIVFHIPRQQLISQQKEDSRRGAGISLAIFLALHMRELCNIAWAIFVLRVSTLHTWLRMHEQSDLFRSAWFLLSP